MGVRIPSGAPPIPGSSEPGIFCMPKRSTSEDIPRRTRPGRYLWARSTQKTPCHKPRAGLKPPRSTKTLQHDTLQALARCSKDAPAADATPSVPKTAPKSVPTCESTDLRAPDDVLRGTPAKKRLGWKEDPPRIGWRVDNAKEHYGTAIHSAVPDRCAHRYC